MSRHRARPLTRYEAAELAERIATAEWKRMVRRTVIAAVGPELWSAFQFGLGPQSCRHCWVLAAGVLAPRARDRLLANALTASALPTAESRLSAALLASCTLPRHLAKLATARAVQLLGVFACAQLRQDLGDCECLVDLAEGVSAQLLSVTLREGLHEATRAAR